MVNWKNIVEGLKNTDFAGKAEEAQKIIDSGDLEKAKLFLGKELDKKPKSTSLLFVMAGLGEEVGLPLLAWHYLERFLAIKHDDAVIYNKARIEIDELDEFEMGLKTIKLFRDNSELEQRIQELKANALLNLDKFKECEKICKKIMKADPNSSNCIRIYADCCYNQENFQKSFELNEKIIELDSTDIEAQNNKADLLIRLEKYDEALSISDDIISQNSSDEQALANKGEVLIKKSQFRDAIISLQNSVSIDSTYEDGWILLAKAQAHENLIDDALDSLLVATSLEPELLGELKDTSFDNIRNHERFQRLLSKHSEI